MNIEETMTANQLVLRLIGRLDTSQAPAAEKKMMKVLDQGHDRLVLDCQELDYISSSGLRVFLMTQKKMMERSGELKICSLQPNIKEIFDISGFSLIFSISPDLDAACKT